RAVDPDAADVRIEREAREAPGLDRAPLERVVDVEQRGVVRRKERDADLVRPGRNRQLEIDRLQLPVAAAEPAADVEFLVPVEERHSLAVEQHLELLAADLAERAEVAHVAEVDREDLEAVRAVGREEVLDQQA